MAKKKKKRGTAQKRVLCDYHHIFYVKRNYECYWSKVLREHPYCGAYIPQETLHQAIHAKIYDVPTPDMQTCRTTVDMLNTWLDAGCISLDDRLDVKIRNIASCLRKRCPNTALVLDWQERTVSKFYGGG